MTESNVTPIWFRAAVRDLMRITGNAPAIKFDRAAENARLIERSKNRADSLAAVPASSTWFQPRALVKKDQTEIARIFGDK